MKTTPIQMTALAVALAAAFPALAQSTATPTTLTPVIVTANGIPTRDSDATYASEVHDRAAIEASGATSLTGYLGRNTSLNVLPGFGNGNAPLVDMRGYGIGNGAQSVAIFVDGRRLNEIDLVNPLLGSIPLSAVESIEISKGSGSVAFGDSAMAGVVNIRTRSYNGASISAITGSRGFQSIAVSAGLTRELFDLSATATNDKQGHSSDRDITGAHDGGTTRTEQAKLTLKPMSGLKLFIDGMSSNIDTRYVNALTASEFRQNPAQLSQAPFRDTYTHQHYEARQMRVGFEHEIVHGLTARYSHNREDKSSQYLTGFPSISYYDYTSDDASLSYRSSQFDLTGGVQRFQGDKVDASNRTSKENTAYYLQGVYRIGQWALSAGGRKEKVEYEYAPNAGAGLTDKQNLSAWDIGANYRLDNQWSAFANYNYAFQAAVLDQFFVTDFMTGAKSFNQFINPARSRTVNLGINYDTARNKLRAAIFYSKLKDEFYMNPLTFSNGNIDKSHKYGLELQDRWQARENLSFSVLYTYTRAIIDAERTDSGVDIGGKQTPGVPRHGLTLGVSYKPWETGTFNINHVWRDSAYAINDLSNNFQNRQGIFSSTSLSFRQRYGKFEGFVGVDNVFDHANGIWVEDTAVYPVEFRRTWRIGAKVDLF